MSKLCYVNNNISSLVCDDFNLIHHVMKKKQDQELFPALFLFKAIFIINIIIIDDVLIIPAALRSLLNLSEK